MQVTSEAYRAAYEVAESLYAQPKVIIDWNHNRFSEIVVPSNAGDTAEDENFPITSIVHSMRGRTGLVKGRVGEARTYRSRENEAPQYRTVGPRSNYKYWESPAQSGLTGNITNTAPQVVYGAPVNVNKIVVALETTVAWPIAWKLQTTTNGTFWTDAATSTNVTLDPSDGIVTIYLQENGSSWSTTPNTNAATSILGVRFAASRMNAPSKHLSVIELAAHLEQDVSDIVMSVSTDRNTDESSLVFPVGAMTSNSANITLDNTDERFDRDNESSPFYGLIDSNAEVRVSFGTNVSAFGGGMEYIDQGVYYVDSWGDSTSGSTVDLQCSDFSKFLQTMQMHPVLFIDRTPGQIIAEILSSVGFRNYSIDIANAEQQAKIPYAWFTGDDNAWEAIQSICNSTQSTIFTDESGVLRYVSRDKTFENAADEPDYIVTALDEGVKLANLEDVSHNFDVEANKVSVTYRPLTANSRKVPVDRVVEILSTSPFKNSATRRRNVRTYDTVPIDSVLWKPEDTITLRAAQLQQTISSTQTYLNIHADDATTWPWSGYMNIEGEMIAYEGKQYRYWSNGAEQLAIVKSKEEQERIDDMLSDLNTRHKNHYTGRFENLKRGFRDTIAKSHSRDLSDWAAWRKDPNGAVGAVPVRLTHSQSHMILNGYSGDSNETYTTAMRGLFTDQYKVYGTRFKHVGVPYYQGTAGLFFHMQADRTQAYYVEINLTDHVLNNMKGGIAEFRTYRMMENGTRRALPDVTANAYGVSMPIVRDRWYDIDVTFEAGPNLFRIYFDGRLVHSFVDPQGLLPPGTWGPFIRGHSVAAFEYFYVANNADNGVPDIEESSFRHKLTGSFASGYADRETSRRDINFVNWFMDDFGPWVHEVRQFSIEFDKVPALDAHVYLSNTWDAYLIEGNRTAFDANFWIANAGRDSAVLNGDDPTVYIGGGDIRQQMLVYGQLITEDEESSVNTTTGDYTNSVDEDENSVTYSNEYAIRKRGTVELSVDSKWIQSKSQAEALGEWITNHWSEPVDNVTVTGFFNPAVQLGDLVAVNHPDRNMLPDKHRYHVVGINFGFTQGIETSLTLRRVR